ncbi:MAG: 16S rRNA (cytosine(967)-C(5))-methyltransferase RsmB [Thermodesulfovibrio sp.]|nr:16S rRNA (cytosine(967)-C(5))-methyltransferase RsmB [Thermodesulfovibrio sp.]
MVYEQQNPRKEAVEILTYLFEKRKPLKILLTENLLNKFNENDRAFLKEIVHGVLRNLYFIDWILAKFYRNKKRLLPKTINNLRCAIYQLIFMKLPSYAVTNESVKVEKSLRGFPSLVNAILRNFLREYPSGEYPLPLSEKFTDIEKYLSIKYSYPPWLVKRYLKRFTQEEIEPFLKANNDKPPFTIAVKPKERNEIAEYLNKKGFLVYPTKYAPSGLKIEGKGYEIRKALQKLPFFWLIQDEASQLACFFLEVYENDTILDVCSSPGGKALLSAALMERGRILCLEKNKERLKILNQNIKRVKKFLPNIKIESLLMDIFEFRDKNNFNKIILDAPCSSLGVIRRNPDVRYRCSESEIARLSEMQFLMLDHVSKYLTKGGTLLYCVCSTEPEEGERVVEKFLHNHEEFYTINSEISFFKDLYIDKGMIRTYPHIHDMDGFFMARILRC